MEYPFGFILFSTIGIVLNKKVGEVGVRYIGTLTSTLFRHIQKNVWWVLEDPHRNFNLCIP
jgi:hypothetical protein